MLLAKSLARKGVLIVLAVVGIGIYAAEGRTQVDQRCSLIANALGDQAKIKVGDSREQLERYFIQDGGMQSPEQNTYDYRKCNYLKVDVTFRRTNSDVQSREQDTITSMSRMYVQLPRYQ